MPQLTQCLLQSLERMAGDDAQLQRQLEAWQRHLQHLLSDDWALQAHARHMVQTLVLIAQAVLMREHASPARADAFVATRLASAGVGGVIGASTLAKAQIPAILSACWQ